MERDWHCWEFGCEAEANSHTYQAAGMRQLVKAVRSTGARQPILLSGINYAHKLTGWESHLPPIPATPRLPRSTPMTSCLTRCRAGLAVLARSHPLVSAEIGESDCGHTFIRRRPPRSPALAATPAGGRGALAAPLPAPITDIVTTDAQGNFGDMFDRHRADRDFSWSVTANAAEGGGYLAARMVPIP